MKESESNEDNKSNEVEEKLLHQFYFLKEEQNSIKIFGEYNFDESEEIILEIWQKIIKYLLEDILCCMEISITDLKRYTKIKNKEPLGLKNILIRLRYNKKYITLNDLNNEKFYEMNFPDLYPKEQSQSSSLFSFLSLSNWCRGEETNQNKNKNDNNKIGGEENSCRKDISEKEEIPENSILFNYDIFIDYCEAILTILNEILENKKQKIIKKTEFKDILSKDYIDKNNPKNGNFKLRYGDKNIDIAFHYLEKTKKIRFFDVKKNNLSHSFIKVLTNKDDIENEEDKKKAESLLEEKEDFVIV